MITALLRTVILYFLIMTGLRLMGKRQIGELEPSELVLTMMISDLATVPMQDFGIPLLAGVIGPFSLAGRLMDVSEILYKLKEGKIKHDVILDDNTLFIKTIRMVSRRIAYVIMLIGLFIGSIVLIVFDRDNGYGHFILIATSILILLQMLKWLFSRR